MRVKGDYRDFGMIIKASSGRELLLVNNWSPYHIDDRIAKKQAQAIKFFMRQERELHNTKSNV